MPASQPSRSTQLDIVACRLFGVALADPDARAQLQRAIPPGTPHHEEQRDRRSAGAVRTFLVDVLPQQHAELHWSTPSGGPLAMVYVDYPTAGPADRIASGPDLDSTTGTEAAARSLASTPGVAAVERTEGGVSFTANGFRARLRWDGGRIVAATLARSIP